MTSKSGWVMILFSKIRNTGREPEPEENTMGLFFGAIDWVLMGLYMMGVVGEWG